MKSALLVFVALVLLLASVVPGYAATSDIPSSGLLDIVADFLRGVFVPSNDYFSNQVQRLSELVDKKLGGISYLFKTIREFFNGLSSPVTSPLEFSFPDNYFFQGYKGLSVNLLSQASEYLTILKGVLNSALCLLTAFACYKRLTSLFYQ